MKTIISTLINQFKNNVTHCYYNDKDFTPFVVAYNTYQDDERCAVDYLFNIQDKLDLQTCVGGGLSAQEIANLVNTLNEKTNNNATPFFFFGENHTNPKLLTQNELFHNLIGWSDDIIEYIFNNPHSVNKDLYHYLIGRYLNTEDKTENSAPIKTETKVYIVVQHIVEDCCEVTLETKPFFEQEEAFRYFNSIAKEEYIRALEKGWEIESTCDEFCAFEDGYYAQNHSYVTIGEHIIM